MTLGDKSPYGNGPEIAGLIPARGTTIMPNHIKFCSCQGCRVGKRSARAKFATRRLLRGMRQNTKTNLRKGLEPINTVSAGYTS